MKSIITFVLFVVVCGSVHAQSKIKFQKKDSLKLNFCNCDSIYKMWAPKSNSKSDAPEFTGNGWNRLYNFQNQIGNAAILRNSISFTDCDLSMTTTEF